MKIRHYGILANRAKTKLKIQQMKMGISIVPKTKMDWKQVAHQAMGFDVDACPCCKTGRMHTSTALAPTPHQMGETFLLLSNKLPSYKTATSQMMGTKTYCSTNKNQHEMIMIFYHNHNRCFHAHDFLFEKCLPLCPVGLYHSYYTPLSSIKIP